MNNPPSDDKLRRLEQSLGFTVGELVGQAHLQRTPRDVRVVLQKLMGKGQGQGARGEAQEQDAASSVLAHAGSSLPLDEAFMSGVLQELVDRSAGNVEAVRTNAVPVINRVSAGYPKDFTDMSYPRGVADEYLGCPDVHDKDAFAARVHGDSMVPKYQQGDIVIFSPSQSVRSGDDCFVRFNDGQTTFKRVFFESDDARTPVIRLQPRNEKYRPQIVTADKISGLYKALYRYQRVDE